MLLADLDANDRQLINIDVIKEQVDLAKKLECVKQMVDDYTASDMNINGEVKYPNDFGRYESDNAPWAFDTHSQSALMNYQPDG